MMLTFITIQGFRDKLIATLTPNAENPRTVVGVSQTFNMFAENQFSYCRKLKLFMSSLYMYAILMAEEY